MGKRILNVAGPVTLIVAEDNIHYLSGLLKVLGNLGNLQVAATASNGRELMEAVQKSPPRLVLTDIEMPLMNGIEATRQLKERWPAVEVIALTAFPDENYIAAMLTAGAMGYVDKNCSEEDLADAIETVCEGYPYHCRTTIMRVSKMFSEGRVNFLRPEDRDISWSETELQIIRLVCQGLPYKQIAPQVGLTLQTLYQYCKLIIQKARVKSMVGVARYAAKRRLFDHGKEDPGKLFHT